MGETIVLGKSMIVPSVQELANGSKLENVPDRYIRPDLDTPISSTKQNQLVNGIDPQVPVIDMKGLIFGDSVELKKLHLACQEWGFFQIINHGVNSSLVDKFKKETQEFFNLPIEEKKRFWQTPDELEGYGQAFVFSEDQKLDWADMFYLTTFPIHERRSHLMPLMPSPFRETLEDYSAETRNLGLKILEYMQTALGIDSQLREVFGEGQQMMRMNYYPACPQPDKVIGLNPHSDSVGLTILLQLNEMEGLQIMKDGKWIPVKPLDNAFVVNIGDILEILSNGIYKSIMHRAVVNASKERLSVAAFFSPSLNKEIGPIPELIAPGSRGVFRRIAMLDYWQALLTRPLEGKSYIEAMRINDSDE